MPRKPPTVHVSPKGGGEKGWKVTQGGEQLSTHRTQSGAEAAGRREAKADGTELAIHNREGVIRDTKSYGNDPNPPKDKR